MAIGLWRIALGKFLKNYFLTQAGKPVAKSNQPTATLPVTFSIQTLLPSKEVVDCLRNGK